MAEHSIRQFLVAEFVNMRRLDRTTHGKALQVSRRMIENCLRDARRAGDLDTLLATEKAILESELQLHANSRAMRTSLETSIAELDVATRMVGRVRDQAAYREFSEGFSLPRNRIGGVPRDEARQFFRSHAARLLNQDKSRLDESEKRVLDRRRLNMRHAEKLYAALQERALGIEADRDRGVGPGS